MSSTQAVIFTHCAELKESALENTDLYIDKYASRFRAYLECNREEFLIGLVYGYVDLGVRETILKKEGGNFELSPNIMAKDGRLKGILRQAEIQAQKDSYLDPNRFPQFQFVGLNELVNVLNNLTNVDPNLISFLGSREQHFYYDSPKFVEAVIRLARGDIPHLAKHPIIRIDDDAEVNPQAIKKLLEKFKKVSVRGPFYLFSGRYKRFSDSNYDPVNDYAVRTHWFFPPGTKAGDPRFSNGNSDFKKRVKLAEMFLADLSVLGATQPLPDESKYDYSQALKDLINQEKEDLERLPEAEQEAFKLLTNEARPSPQVISGAGLIMGRRNVELLPPFMNFDHPIIWVDDHLKRRLHEMLGDIGPTNFESIVDATFQQNRHEDDITQKDIDDTKSGWYFKRLLEGCLLHAMITDRSGKKDDPSYAELIRDIVWFKKTTVNESVKETMRQRLRRIGIQRYEVVLKCWSSPDFKDYASYDWANQQFQELEKERRCKYPNKQVMVFAVFLLIQSYYNLLASRLLQDYLCEDVVTDAIDYLDLLLNWHKFTRAIERLPFIDSWLFESGIR